MSKVRPEALPVVRAIGKLFAGSGSTCMAVRQIGRRFYGIEIDPKYHAAATHRLALANPPITHPQRAAA